jgi:hypothetical protein
MGTEVSGSLASPKIDTSKDPDFFKITLRVPAEFTTGTVSLVSTNTGTTSEFVADEYVTFYDASGLSMISGTTMIMNLASPSGPLDGITSGSGVSFLVESQYLFGQVGAKLKLKYTGTGSALVNNEAAFHVVNVDFKENAEDSGFDENDDPILPDLANPGLMVPLGTGGGEGTNSIKIDVQPATLRDRIKIWTEEPSTGSVGWTLPPSSDTPIRIRGYSHDTTELVASVGSLGAEMSRMYVDVKNCRGVVDYFVYRVILQGVQTDEPDRIAGKIPMQNFLQEVWAKQANVILGEGTIFGPAFPEIAYDVYHADEKLEAPQNSTLEMIEIYNGVTLSGPGFPVFVVKEINVVEASALATVSATAAFIDENTPLVGLAQEVGHCLGIPEDYDDQIDLKNVMSDPVLSATQKHVRRKDWNKVNQ